MTMHKVIVSEAARYLLAAEAKGVLADGVQRPDGSWLVEVDDEVFAALEKVHPFDVTAAVIAVCGDAKGGA